MKIDSATWSRISELFDAVVDMPLSRRRDWLDRHAPSGEIRRHLDSLLTAHDTPDPLLVDRAVDDIVDQMLGEKAMGLNPIPEDLAGRVFGNWRAVEEIGRGGMSVVLRGERADGQFEKSVAIKLLPPGPTSDARRERLRAEVRLLARLEHPGIAHLIDGGVTEEGMPFLVMEYVDGIPITCYCERHGLGLRERVALIDEVADALTYSHARLIVHCDIKPSNVLVNREGRVKLVDFGIAAMLREESSDESTRPALHCSPAHAAPEQLRGEPPAVTQDVFALGGLLYELLSGCRIRDARQTTSVFLGKPLRHDITPPSMARRKEIGDGAVNARLTGDLDAICLKALAADPAERYSGIDALKRDLANWREDRPVAARSAGPMYRSGKWLRRHRWTAAAAGLVAASLMAGSSLAIWQAREAEAALVKTEQALQRAESLHEFLLGLFRAAEPNRPREQLPDTEEVLALGARRAMDESSAPPPVRLGMLLAIARVYLAQQWPEEAEPLLLEAEALARSRADLALDLSRALTLRGTMAIMEGRLDDAEIKLQEAERVATTSAAGTDAYTHARSITAWIAYMRGDATTAVDILKPLYRDGLDGRVLSDRTRYRVLDSLAAAYLYLGHTEEAAALRSEATPLIRAMEGPESRTYAINLSNLALLDMRLGYFDQAIERLERSIELFDAIFDQPTEWQSAARGNLAHTFLYIGKEDRVLEEMDRAASEWAVARGRAAEDYEFRFHSRGQLLLRLHRWDEAEASLAHAAELFDTNEGASELGRQLNQALLARALCRRGRVDEGRRTIARLDRDLDGEMPASPTRSAEIEESRATCQYYAGEHQVALDTIDRALELMEFRGYVVQRGDRLELKARILVALDRREDALDSLQRAKRLFAELDLNDHPGVSRLHSARRELDIH